MIENTDDRLYWRLALLWSIPTALTMQFIIPISIALIEAPFIGIVCTASVHGDRAWPCSFRQLVSEWIEFAAGMNFFLVGIPTIISYCISLAVLGPIFSYLIDRKKKILKSNVNE